MKNWQNSTDLKRSLKKKMKNRKTIFSSKNSKIYIFLFFLQISKAGLSRCIFSSLKFAAADDVVDVVDVVNA
jgi:hypothetical protein